MTARRAETATASTLCLRVEDWNGHLPGQHVDVRLTAPDGYQAARSYSLAAPAAGGVDGVLEITVQRLPDGEVSAFLTDDLVVGDRLELRGPLGNWFVWQQDDPAPVLLVAGGAGLVPLMSMIRARDRAHIPTPFRLIHSVRTPDDRIYADELERLAAQPGGPSVTWLYTRTAPQTDKRRPGRLRPNDLNDGSNWTLDAAPTCFVCGPTGFVEEASNHLLAAGHHANRIRTERFGGR
ncbi:ferredoxin reductase [Pimelobacter simplex]|uniref:ferredoxin reductase n=1 Tax=Nocardioides simplex TaxID=2045 RepID=UPI0027DCA27D